MPTDPRKLAPGELCGLLNSTPLGEVLSESRLRDHRRRAGSRIGAGKHVDLLRYTAWLVSVRHTAKPAAAPSQDLAQSARGAAVLGSRKHQVKGHGQKLDSRQEAVIAALLTEPTYSAAAKTAGVSETTLYRWLHMPAFRAAYRSARRELIEAAVGRIQAATGQAVETLVAVARQGRREGDRVRAAVALLEHACRGLHEADVLHGNEDTPDAAPMNGAEVMALLASRLRQLDRAEVPTAEKSRLTVSLADALLRAIATEVLEKEVEAIKAVLDNRKVPT